MRRFRICPNSYYNYLKNRNAEYYKQKKRIKDTITHLYHKHHGIIWYRQMKKFLEREDIHISCTTSHKYMNTELKLHSITRRKKKGSASGQHHKAFDNLLKRDFTVKKPNQKWCVDFTYLFLQNGSKRYTSEAHCQVDRGINAGTFKKIWTQVLQFCLTRTGTLYYNRKKLLK